MPLTVTVYVPGNTPPPTVKLPVTIPNETPQVGAVISPVEGPVAVIAHAPVSEDLKKLPLTVTIVPLTPVGGDSVMVGVP